MLIEQKLTVMQKEVNEALGEMQKAMSLLMQTNKTALQALQFQIAELGKVVNAQGETLIKLEDGNK
jgi:hypothetical protein